MSKATIVSVTKNQKNSRANDICFRIDGKDKDWTIIDFSGKGKLIKAGDRVDIGVEKNDKGFWGITNLQVIHDSPNGFSSGGNSGVVNPTQSSAPSVAHYGGQNYRNNDPDTNKRIQRSVALKCAVDLMIGMMANGYIKKTANIDLINALISDQCAEWEQYLTLQKDYTPIGTTSEDNTEAA